jgi:hypothetical protein
MTKTIRGVILALACAGSLAACAPTTASSTASDGKPAQATNGLGGSFGGGY